MEGVHSSGTGSRLFLIDGNDCLQRLSIPQLGRLLRFDKQVTLPRYAEKRVRCAMAILEVDGRQVRTIRHIDYFILPFDAKGRIDKDEWTRGVRLALELLPSAPKEEHSKQVIDARDRFMKRRYENEFKWEPTRKIEEEIMAAILGSTLRQV